jgi:molecular chaperone Hsp33
MPASTPVNVNDSGIEVSTAFVRSRNVLVSRADFGPLLIDYYLHLSDQKIRYSPEQDSLFKKTLAAFVLHCATRPHNEMTAWTIHFEALHQNIFLTGDNENGSVVGRIFTENVKEMDGNYFYSDVVRGVEPKRRSVAKFQGDDPFAAIEAFYRHSEQRAVKVFALGDEQYALLSEHPDCDRVWFDALSPETVKTLATVETVTPMERRIYRWHCGCNQGRMLQVLAPAYRDDPDDLFGAESVIELRCPRCGARHNVTREAMDAYMVDSKKE